MQTHTTPPQNERQASMMPQWMIWGMVALIFIAIVFSGVTLTKYPISFVDEGWFSNSAWNWVVNGVHFDTMHAGPLDQYGFEWLRRNFLAEGVWSLGFMILGVGFAQARFIAWIIGLGVLGLTFLIARRLYDLPTALLAVLLLAISEPFLRAAHFARQDGLLALFGLLGFGFGAYALQTRRWWAHIIGAFVVGFSINIHQNGVTYVLGYACMYLIHYGRSLLLQREAWLAAFSGALGSMTFLFLHIFPNPDVYFRTLSINLMYTHPVPILQLSSIPVSIWREIITTYDFDHEFIAFFLIGSGGLTLLLRRSTVDRQLLAFVGGSWLGFVLLVGNKLFLYAILLYPFMMLIVAAGATHLLQKFSRADQRRVRYVVAAAVCALIVNDTISAVHRYSLHREYDYNAIIEKFRTVIPPGARVMGLPSWWFGFANDEYQSNFTINFYKHLNGLTFDESMALLQPDYFIEDFIVTELLVDENDPIPTIANASPIPRSAYEAMLAKRGALMLEFEDRWHGKFRVYALNWDE